ncbi:hypothetical protein Acr_07g0006190 [Actinidia rufa]|uniref:SWIB domain-containing protein n=1 Tax=Actinidia rufa TaxID=165716 RepID=A0A7J0EVL3_9ERIC|nr:hypothetical protein Acr_07g0006190 [Actinidia rufa]
MSSTSGVFKGCRALFAAAKEAAPKPSAAKTAAGKPKPPPPSRPAKPRSSSSEPRKPSRPTGILKECPVSPALHHFLGVQQTSRSDAVKKVWEYIKLHNLQLLEFTTRHKMSFGSGGSESSRTIGKQSNVDDLAKDEELGFEDRNRGVQGRGSDLLVAKKCWTRAWARSVPRRAYLAHPMPMLAPKLRHEGDEESSLVWWVWVRARGECPPIHRRLPLDENS